MAQEGSFASGMADAFAKVASIGLQYGVPIQTIIKQLEYMRFDPNGFTGDPDIPFATSVADFTAQWLKKTFVDKDGGVTAKISLPLASNGTESKDSTAAGEEREKEKDKEGASNQTTIFASEMNAYDQKYFIGSWQFRITCPDCMPLWLMAVATNARSVAPPPGVHNVHQQQSKMKI